MPAPGDQHNGGNNTANPFEEVKSHISEYTAQEIASLQSRLQKQLGPEYISSRSGPGGQKLHYIPADKCIQLANEVFGFNGWSSQIKDLQVDFLDENPTTGKVNLGLSVIVRVSLRDGTFHEDIGYGHIENCKGKAAAFEKAKKEGTTDAMKRALRNFGNVLGNCIYDKEYLAKVTKVKVAPTKWEVDNLYRHGTYATKKEETAPDVPVFKQEPDSISSPTARGSFEDEFDDGAFDETDFTSAYDPDSHPDEIALPDAPPPAARHNSPGRPVNGPGLTAAGQSAHNNAVPNQARQPQSRPQQMQAPSRPQPQNNAQMAGARPPQPRPQHPSQPQTPNGSLSRSSSGAGRAMPQPPTANPTGIPQGAVPGHGRVLNQPNRQRTPPPPPNGSASPSFTRPQNPDSDPTNQPFHPPPDGNPPIGFFSAKAALLPTDGQAPDGSSTVLPKTAVFNPHSESPSIRKTPGIDHTKTIPVNRNFKQAPNQPPGTAAVVPVRGNINVVNPQLDATRRVGAPGSPSPLGNRGSYKPPTMVGKRPGDVGGAGDRLPLGEVPMNGGVGGGGGMRLRGRG
ncbi:DNA repair protein [Pseudogymnoascus destructans]|uniref:RAD52 homolog n=1 Tax=Pseudogymnoascus destructans TaxID=655981 RepID=A0A177AC19_9PEZI|nr:DNA repair protein [Pseudogymnoascus destructans]OAF59638.1 DNA repair protein [Pseudogymnoascus destructans]